METIHSHLFFVFHVSLMRTIKSDDKATFFNLRFLYTRMKVEFWDWLPQKFGVSFQKS